MGQQYVVEWEFVQYWAGPGPGRCWVFYAESSKMYPELADAKRFDDPVEAWRVAVRQRKGRVLRLTESGEVDETYGRGEWTDASWEDFCRSGVTR